MVNELVLLTQAEEALANIGDITDAKNLIDIAKAASVFYAAQGLREQSDRAKIIELKAARVAGKLLMVMDKAPGGHPYHNTNEENKPVPTVPTLADLDITKWESHRWQLLARLPDEDFYRWLDEHLGTGYEITAGALIRFAQGKGLEFDDWQSDWRKVIRLMNKLAKNKQADPQVRRACNMFLISHNKRDK